MPFSLTATALGDFFNGAKYNTSGLISVLNDILGKLPQSDHQSVLEIRAGRVGLEDLIRQWQTHGDAAPASEAEIKALFHPLEIERFSMETALSDRAVIEILSSLLPRSVHLRAHASALPATRA